MAAGDLWRSVQSSLSWAGHDSLARIAGDRAQTAETNQRLREQQRREQEDFVAGVHKRIEAGHRNTEMFGTTLPEGFRPLDKLPALVGQYPIHPDGAPLPIPASTMAWLQANKPDVMAKWNQCWLLAILGVPEYQMNLADSLEIGEFGAEPDLIRAFFFFYKAGMRGHAEARPRAEALSAKLGDFRWIIAPPHHVYCGNWRLVQDKFGEAVMTWVFELTNDGSFSGHLTDFGGVAGDRMKAMRSHPIGHMSWNTLMQMHFSGRWSYDRGTQFVTFHISGRVPGGAPEPPETMRLELMAMKMGVPGKADQPGQDPVYFGKDEQGFTYYLTPLQRMSDGG